MQKTYSTKGLANIVGVHVNTLRFYEKIGFLTKPERKENGYRIYTDLHLEQCKVNRLAMKAEVLQNGLRNEKGLFNPTVKHHPLLAKYTDFIQGVKRYE